MEVNYRCGDIGVAQEVLDRPDIDAAFQDKISRGRGGRDLNRRKRRERRFGGLGRNDDFEFWILNSELIGRCSEDIVECPRSLSHLL
jgi:hypothetical protein